MPCRAGPPWLCHATPTVSCHAVLLGHCYAVPCCAVVSGHCCAMLCHAVLHRAKQCRGVRCHGAVPRCAVPSLTFSLPPQCGFFKRSSQTSRYTTNYYRARRRLQPSEADKQALEGQR